MKKIKKKTWFVIIAVVIVIAIAGTMGVKASQGKQDKGIAVRTAAVEKQDIEARILTSGEVLTIEKRDLLPETTGKIKEILVKKGDIVKKGQVLAVMDEKDLNYQIQQATIRLQIEKEELEKLRKDDRVALEVALSNAKIEYQDAKDAYERKKELYEADVVSKTELDTEKSNMDQKYNGYILAESRLQQSMTGKEISVKEKQIQLSQIGWEKLVQDLEKCKIKSPIDGTIIDSTVSEGEMTSENTPIMKIQDTNRLEILVNISEYDIGRIQLGQNAKITGDAFEGKEYAGTVKYIGPTALSITAGQGKETVVEVKIEVTDKDTEMKPGFTANVDILTESKKGVLVLPYEALFTKKSGETVVFVVQDGKAKEKTVLLGTQSDLVVEVISSDLHEGDPVILNPSETLKDNDPVQENKVM
ncbi:efflux RND transporter periplasmic adaptor subunit [Geosporobacter ferrireducens]|uniref:Uncharacterized protein n=1 Tax=Geosporobacter ferrireducens TaxID=1424294 RepID=A0A1D8GGJ7_9FIRM|nr:efflux RND transporter periplasmic adaptor subunit [Geosporobacter ferrireducens]AOT69996.1 hypothetical protein Gferi_10605 [Geosporobacter ferrireducens]